MSHLCSTLEEEKKGEDGGDPLQLHQHKLPTPPCPGYLFSCVMLLLFSTVLSPGCEVSTPGTARETLVSLLFQRASLALSREQSQCAVSRPLSSERAP